MKRLVQAVLAIVSLALFAPPASVQMAMPKAADTMAAPAHGT